MIDRRGFLGFGAAAFAAAGSQTVGRGCAKEFVKDYSYNGKLIRIPFPGVQGKLRVWVIGDTHFVLRDSRDDAYADNYRRMGQWGGDTTAFETLLAKAKAEKPDMLLLAGDIISFPTLANVEFVKARLDACGIPWFYTAGNHDWHFEGVPGSDLAQREEWTRKRLLPLHQGANPFMSSRVVKGVRIVAIDNSAYHVLPEQVAFWKQEAAKGDPIALIMHVPFWHEGWSVTSCACPTWGAATDPYPDIERRERWAEKLMPSTFEFRQAVFSTPNLVGIFTGHHHRLQFARADGQNCFGTPEGRKGEHLEVEIG